MPNVSKQFLGLAALGLALGLAYFVIDTVRGDPGAGAAGLAIMLGYLLVLWVFRHRVETAHLLGAGATDERQAQVMLRGLAFTGGILTWAVVLAMFVSLALGSQYAAVFSGLAALGGVSFAGSIAWFSRRT